MAIAAARTGQLKILKYLWEKNSETMLLHRFWWLPPFLPRGTTPCHEAASCGHSELVVWLLEHRADVLAKDGSVSACTPLHLAAIHGHRQVVYELCKSSLDDGGVDQIHVNSTTALHQAAFGGHLSTVKTLLEVEADVNRCDALGQTALHYAALRGHTKLLVLLGELVTSVNVKDQHGRSPLHACAAGFDPENIEVMLIPLGLAASPTLRDENLDAAIALLSLKADLHSRDQEGQSPSQLALLGQHWEVAKVLGEELERQNDCAKFWRGFFT